MSGRYLTDDFAEQKIGELTEDKEEGCEDEEPSWANFVKDTKNNI